MISIFDKIFDKLGFSLNFLNRQNSPSNKAIVKGSSVGSIQQAGGNIHNVFVADDRRPETRPRLDIVEYGGTGGPDGYYMTFKTKNDGSETAVDVTAELIADDFHGSFTFPIAHNLSPGQESRILNQRYDATDFQMRQLTNPRLVLRYKSPDGRVFASGRTIIQDSRADGRYDIHRRIGTYFEGRGANAL